MTIAIIKYNAGNTASVTNALLRLGITPQITDDPAGIRAASHVIFPGVGTRCLRWLICAIAGRTR